MNRYTVILIYPQDIANYDGENYLAHVEADTPHQAASIARNQCAKDNGHEPDADEYGRDLIIAAIFWDHCNDLK
jgi:hypothetical protein